MLRLCTVLGREAAERAELLLKLGTFLNDPDWELRATLFDQLPHVAAFFGPVATRKMIVPFVQQHLADAVERVVSRALECVVRLVDATGPVLLTTELELELPVHKRPPHAVSLGVDDAERPLTRPNGARELSERLERRELKCVDLEDGD